MNDRQKTRWLSISGVLLALIAAGLSAALLSVHVSGSADLGILASVCGDEGSGCDVVVNSRWGTLPPSGPPSEEGEEKGGGVPVAALGLLYYLLMALWHGLIGRPDLEMERLHRGVFLLNGLGVIGSVVYAGLMLGVIGTTCALCMATHFLNLGLLYVTWKNGPRWMAEGAVHPSSRLLAAGGLLVALIGLAEWRTYQVWKLTAQGAEVARLKEELDRFERLSSDFESFEAVFLGQEKLDLDVRADDPTIPKTDGNFMSLVMFSDIECLSCERFDLFLHDKLLPLFSDHLRVTWKHFPLKKHPNAMPGAKALEAARLQGKFWELREWLGERRETLGAIDWLEAAEANGLDGERFLADMESPAVMARIQADMRTGRKAGVSGTPGIFHNARPVSSMFRTNFGFWKIRADRLKNVRTRKNQEW